MITFAELQSRVSAGSASRPISKLTYRLCAPLRWWSRSILRMVAVEICSLPLRIRAILSEPSLRLGVPITAYPEDCSGVNLATLNSYLHACTGGIRRLRRERPVVSALETQTYARAFRQGATWGVRNVCSGSSTQSARQDSSTCPS